MDKLQASAGPVDCVRLDLVPDSLILGEKSLEIISQHMRTVPIKYIDEVIDLVSLTVNETLHSVFDAHKCRLDLDRQEAESGLAKLEKSLNSELAYQFDKFELYALQSVFSFPKKLEEHVKTQKFYAQPHMVQAENIQRQIDELHKRIAAMKKLHSSLLHNIEISKRQMNLAHEQKDILLNFASTESTLKFKDSFKNLLKMVEMSISLSDLLEAKLEGKPRRNVLCDNGNRLDLQKASSTVSEALKNLFPDPNQDESDIIPLNEFEIYKYTSDCMRLFDMRGCGSLEV